MTAIQEFPQVDQLATLSSHSLLEAQDFNLNNRVFDAPESCNASAPSANIATTPALINTEATPEDDVREPLKELSEHSKGNNEVANQEQEEEQEKSEQSTDKLNEYVTKVLEKLLQQKTSMAKLGSILDKKGLKYNQLQELIQGFEEVTNESTSNEDDAEDPNGRSKENLSPIRAKQASSKPEFVVASPEKSALVVATTQKVAPKFRLEDVLQISKKNIHFGTRFPGQIVEEHLEIVNKSGQDFVVQIYVNCLNEELDNSDEYVFSVRRSHLYDYNDKHYLIMAPYSSASFKFALKVPNMKVVGEIEGQVKVGIQGQSCTHLIDLSASVTIPKVFCPKELNFRGLNYNVIKLAMKEGKKQDIKLPIRNNGNVPVTLELEFYESKDKQETQGKPMFDCLVHPSVITINPNSATITNVLVKPLKGASSTLKEMYRQKPAQRVLTGKVRDSALIYSFVFWIEFY